MARRQRRDPRDHALVARRRRPAASAARRRCRPPCAPASRARSTNWRMRASRRVRVDMDLGDRWRRGLQAHGDGVEAEQDLGAHRAMVGPSRPRLARRRSGHHIERRLRAAAGPAASLLPGRRSVVPDGLQRSTTSPMRARPPKRRSAPAGAACRSSVTSAPARPAAAAPPGTRAGQQRRAGAQQPLPGGQAPQHHAQPGQHRHVVFGDRLVRDQADPVGPAACRTTGAARSRGSSIASGAERPQPARAAAPPAAPASASPRCRAARRS